jgi:hypothetical protein
MTSTLYGDLLRAGVPMDSHESDLYALDTALAREILAKFPESAKLASRFESQLDGEIWWDVPFAYLPWWQARATADALRHGESAPMQIAMPDLIEPGDLKD